MEQKWTTLVVPLQDHGADVNHETKDGATPLKVAVHKNKGELCALLIKRGADPSLKVEGSTSALDEAQIKV